MGVKTTKNEVRYVLNVEELSCVDSEGKRIELSEGTKLSFKAESVRGELRVLKFASNVEGKLELRILESKETCV